MRKGGRCVEIVVLRSVFQGACLCAPLSYLAKCVLKGGARTERWSFATHSTTR